MRYFYDSHCHMMNLSHPNLTAMIKRTFNDGIKRKLLLYSPALLLIPLLFTIGLKILIYFGIRIPEKIYFLDAFVILTLIAAVIVIMFFIIFLIPVVRAKTVSFIKLKLSNIMNLLAIMETDIGDCLIQMEEDLRKNLPLNSSLVISGNGETKQYDKMVLTPLIMDFGLKDSGKSSMTYKVRWKPIVAQVEDLCTGIRDYYRHRKDYIKDISKKSEKI